MLTATLQAGRGIGAPERIFSPPSCPECGDRMRETERSEEGSAVFVWYECMARACPGQRLTMHPRQHFG